MQKNLFLVLILFGMLVNTEAQITVNGTIKDKDNSTSISGVSIYQPELNSMVLSDLNGNFTLTFLNKNNLLLEFTKKNYNTLTIDLQTYTTLTELNKIKVDFELVPSAIEMKKVLIIGKSNRNNTRSVVSIQTDEMVKNGNLNISDALSQLPGISTSTYSTGIMRPVIRGLSGNRILTVMNGTRIENQQWDPEHSFGLTQYGIGQIEIIKGPTSFLYGSDAMGGVIKFTDEKPAALNTISVDASTGFMSNTFGTNSGFAIKGAKQKMSWGLAAGINNHSDYYNADFVRVANSRFREITTKMNVDFYHKKSFTQLYYLLNIGYYGIVEPFEKDTAGGEKEDHPMEFETPYHTMMHHLFSVKHTAFFKNSKLVATLSYQNDNRKELEKNDTEDKSYLGLNLHNLFADVKYEYNLSKISVITIGASTSLTNNSNEGYGRIIPNYTQTDGGIYALSQSKFFNNKLQLDIGVRYDERILNTDGFMLTDTVLAIQKTYTNLSSSIAANIEFSPKLHLFSNLSNGFRAPNAAELTSNGVRMETQRFELGNSNFSKETNVMSEMGLNWNDRNFGLSATVYSNAISGYIYIAPTSDSAKGKQVYAYQQANVNINGIEVQANINPKKIDWFRFTTTATILQGTQTNGQYLAQMPAYRLNHNLMLLKKEFYAFKNTFAKIGVINVLAQNNVAANELTTPAYNLVNLSFGGDILVNKQNLQLTAGANNLFNTAYFDHLSAQRKYGVYNMGLNVFVAIKWHFLTDYK